jgi:hypothetical protein
VAGERSQAVNTKDEYEYPFARLFLACRTGGGNVAPAGPDQWAARQSVQWKWPRHLQPCESCRCQAGLPSTVNLWWFTTSPFNAPGNDRCGLPPMEVDWLARAGEVSG